MSTVYSTANNRPLHDGGCSLPKRALTPEERQSVVAEARTWMGTPFHDQADVKGAGVDCGMMLVRVYCDLKLAPMFDPRPYAPQWFMHQGEERYLKWIERYCVRVETGEPGDIQLYRFGRCAAHGTIIVDEHLMIHAYKPAGCVELRERRAPLVHGKIDSLWSPRILA